MGCTSSKITKRFKHKIIIEAPTFKLRKTRLSSESTSSIKFNIFNSVKKFESNDKVIPILRIEDNPLWKNRLSKIENLIS